MTEYKTFKFKDKEFTLDIIYSSLQKTAWITAKQISELFNRNKSTISFHLKNIFSNDNEIQSTEFDFRTTKFDFLQLPFSGKPVKHFNLDVVLEIAKRVKSNRGIMLKTQLDEVLKLETITNDISQIIIYDDGINKHNIKFFPKEETIWVNQSEIADIFETTQENVSMHIKNILKDQELGNSVYKDFLYTAQDNKNYLVTYYNLDMVLAVGYRVRTTKAIKFRKWVSDVFKYYLKNLYESKGPNCIICRNEILELQRDVKQLQLDSLHEIVYYPGDQLRGFIEIKRFIETAKEEVILMDNYLGHKYDDVLSSLNVEKTIITNDKNKKIETCENYKVVKVNDFHDRYVLVDNVCYKFGSSLEEVGDKLSSTGKITDLFLINTIKSMKNNVVRKEEKQKRIDV